MTLIELTEIEKLHSFHQQNLVEPHEKEKSKDQCHYDSKNSREDTNNCVLKNHYERKPMKGTPRYENEFGKKRSM